MMQGKGLLLWVAAASGVMLLYAAYKNESPLTILNRYNGVTSDPTPATPAAPPASPHRAFDKHGNPTVIPPSYDNGKTPYVPGTPY